jgi:small-conductance mechanosensitive channel
MDMEAYLEKLLNWCLTSGLRILVILIIMFVALRIAKMLIPRLLIKKKEGKDEEFLKRTETLGSVINSLLTVTILILALIMVLGEFGISIGPILAAAGIVGVALGFGAQHVVKDVISGFFILFDDQIRVGDVIQIADKGGFVEKVGLRMTILRDLAGNVHYVRNGEINVITNMTKDYSRYVFDIGVAYREDVDEVIKVVKEIDEEMRKDPNFSNDILEPIEILGLDQFADSAVVIKARTKTKPIKQWSVGREFNRRLKKRFDEKNIEIPFPHLTLYLGQDKKGRTTPFNVALKK